jgi:hypothetical protein
MLSGVYLLFLDELSFLCVNCRIRRLKYILLVGGMNLHVI